MGELDTLEAWGPGTTVAGRFVIEALAGAGGGGWVYRARDRDGSLVALKHPRLGNEVHLQRFLREAKVLARLDHPAIVGHVDHGVDEGGQPYLAMAWIEGETLDERLTEGALGVDETLTLGIRIADALAAAHDAGLLHRDVKPGNILLDGGRLDRAVLVDFGLVRVEAPDAATLTRTGVVLGTPAYMSPEQARGKHRELDPRSDVFSLGSVLWECLTGSRAFAADNPLGVIHGIVNVDPPAPSTLCAGVPEHLDRFVARCMAKDPTKRPSDGAAVRLALRALQPSSAPDPEGSSEASHRGVLPGPPALVWALLMDTNRWDRIAGAPATAYRHDDASAPRVGKADLFGVEVEWKEVGEWVEGRWFWGERRYASGPFASIDMRFEVEPHPEGTEVTFRGWATPAPGAAREPAMMLVGHMHGRMRKYFDKLEELLGANPDVTPRPGEPAALAARRLLTRTRSRFLLGPMSEVGPALTGRSAELPAGTATDALLTLLAEGADGQVRQMRPRALAKDLEVDEDELTQACFAATEAGLVDLQLQLDCPACRVAAQVVPSIDALSDHGHCEECHAKFPVALDENVEVVFHPNGAVREVAGEVWCAGSPVFRPHVYAYLRLAPRADREVAIELPSGPLLLRVRGRAPLRVPAPEAGLRLTIGATLEVEPIAGRRLVLRNETDRHLELGVERAVEVEERLTFAEALAIPALHRWVGAAPDRQLGRSVLTIWMAEVADLVALCEERGDGAARQLVGEARRAMRAAVEAHGGAVLEESSGGRLIACFSRTEDAEAADREATIQSPTPLWTAHRTGPCLVGVGADGVELFGATPASCAAAIRT